MSIIVWEQAHNIGIPSIDAQHKNIADMVNGLCVAMQDQQKRDFLEADFQSFMLYTAQHFQYEEMLMEQTKYAELEKHKQEHIKLLKEELELKKIFDASATGQLSIEVRNYLKNWLLEHILDSDKKLAPHLLAQGIS